MAREVELKFRLDPQTCQSFGSLEELRNIEPQEQRFHTTYFDEAHNRLRDSGFELRIRSDGARRMQTLKSGAGAQRGEWESEISQETPQLGEIGETPAATLLKNVDRLRPVFSLAINRLVWRLDRHGASIEVALDRGVIKADGRSRPIREAELELKSGPVSVLFDFAHEIGERLETPLSFVNKGYRGFRLAQDRDESPEHEIDLHLDRDISAQDAFRTIINACLRQFSVNEELLRDRLRSEAVHQARIAVRRMRAAFSMYKEVVTGVEADFLRRELKWLSDLLGDARDKDVFLSGRLSEIELEHPGVPGFADVRARVEEMYRAAGDRLEEALHSQRFRDLLLSLVRFVHDDEKGNDAMGGRFMEFAASELRRRLDAVAKKKKVARGHDALKRHRLRIKAKKLRYMSEFFVPVAKDEKLLAKTSEDLKELQDLLGALNDSIAAERLLGGIACQSQNPAVIFAAALTGGLQAPSPRLRERAIKIHARLRGREPFCAQ
jgi:triphosphatase